MSRAQASAKTKLIPVSSPFPQAGSYEPARSFNHEKYLERTRRNHFWLGGVEAQMRLRELKVGVAGLGGMGSHIAELLVRMGVGHVRIADPDTIEATNLNRQVIAHRGSIGKLKTEASASELRGIATDFELVVYPQGITQDNAAEFVEGCDFIVDEIDVFPLQAHVTLHRAARQVGLPLYSAYAVGMGTHFYKFQGDQYTFEDFLGGDLSKWEQPTAEFLIERFGTPLPTYLDNRRSENFAAEIKDDGTPIFGPTTLLGHSAVVFRIILDHLRKTPDFARLFPKGIPETPVMPNFLVLDLADLSLTIARMPDWPQK